MAQARRESTGTAAEALADVKAAFTAARWRWKLPAAADLAVLAATVEVERARLAARARMPPRPAPDAAARQHVARAERVRDALGTLLRDLPGVAELAAERVPGRHAEVLVGLLAAARRVGDMWPSLDGRHRRLDARGAAWRGAAWTFGRQVLSGARRANPGVRVGLPLGPDQPVCRLIVALLVACGHDVTGDAVAQHFRRTPRQFFLPHGGARGAGDV